MTKHARWWCALLAMVLALAACGDSNSNSEGTGGSGTGGTGGSDTGGTGGSGTGGTGGSDTGGTGGSAGDDDCTRVCMSPCIERVLPVGSVDDCIRACRMGGVVFGTCMPQTIAVIECLETIECGTTGSPACLSQSQAFTACIGG